MKCKECGTETDELVGAGYCVPCDFVLWIEERIRKIKEGGKTCTKKEDQ